MICDAFFLCITFKIHGRELFDVDQVNVKNGVLFLCPVKKEAV